MSEEIKQENKRLLEIINAKPLETVDMDCAFEIEKLKEQLQVKEQKIESLKANIDEIVICDKKLKEMLDTKEQECEKLRKQYNCNACGTCNGKEDYKNMQKHCEKAIAQNRKLENALDEIKEYLKSKDTSRTSLFNISVIEQEILDIINKTNTAPTTIFDKIRSFDSCTLARFIHALISCHENYTCDDCYIATLPFPKRICDTKETLEEIKAWLNEEFKEQ